MRAGFLIELLQLAAGLELLNRLVDEGDQVVLTLGSGEGDAARSIRHHVVGDDQIWIRRSIDVAGGLLHADRVDVAGLELLNQGRDLGQQQALGIGHVVDNQIILRGADLCADGLAVEALGGGEVAFLTLANQEHVGGLVVVLGEINGLLALVGGGHGSRNVDGAGLDRGDQGIERHLGGHQRHAELFGDLLSQHHVEAGADALAVFNDDELKGRIGGLGAQNQLAAFADGIQGGSGGSGAFGSSALLGSCGGLGSGALFRSRGGFGGSRRSGGGRAACKHAAQHQHRADEREQLGRLFHLKNISLIGKSVSHYSRSCRSMQAKTHNFLRRRNHHTR